MKARVHFTLFVLQADANTVRNAINNDLAARLIFARDVDVAARTVNTSFTETARAITGQIRFQSAAEADTFADAVVSRWTSGGIANRILAGSFLERHDCTHDSTGSACVTSQRLVK